MKRFASSSAGLPLATFLLLASELPAVLLILFGTGAFADGSLFRVVNEGGIFAVVGYVMYRQWRETRASPSVPALIFAQVAGLLVGLPVLLAQRSGPGFPVPDGVFLGVIVACVVVLMLIARSSTHAAPKS
jgi:hypothetical protein